MKTNRFLGRDWIDAELDYSKEEWETLIDVGLDLKKRYALGDDHSHLLKGKTLFTMFFNQSLRTRSTFAAGIQQLGGFHVDLEPGKTYTPAREGFDIPYKTERIKDVLLAGAFTALAGLFKPFALHVGVPILILAAMKYRWRLFLKPSLYLYAVVAIVPPLLWIAWAASIGSLGGVTDGKAVTETPKIWGAWSLLWDGAWYYRLQWRLFDRMMTPVVSVLMLAALVVRDARKQTAFFLQLT